MHAIKQLGAGMRAAAKPGAHLALGKIGCHLPRMHHAVLGNIGQHILRLRLLLR